MSDGTLLSSSERITLATLAGVALVLAAGWLVVSLAGLLFGSGWPHLTLAATVTGLVWWVRHPGSPAHGFHHVGLPGPWGFYAALLLVLTSAGGLVLLVRHTRPLAGARRLHLLGPVGVSRGARWGSAGELAELVVSAPAPHRLTLGYHGRRLLATQPRHSVCVIGPSETGKTRGLAIPSMLEWSGPVLCTSVKRDLLDDTLAARRARGDVMVYDPAGVTGESAAHWNPLAGCEDWRKALITARWLVAAADSTPSNSEGRFWGAAAEKLLAPMLFAAASQRLAMGDVLRWVNTHEQAELDLALEAAGEPAAIEAMVASWHREERTLSSVYTTVETILAPYGDPRLALAPLGHELTAARLLDGGQHTAYICAPLTEQERLAPLFATLVMDVVTAAYEVYAHTGRRLDPPLLVVLDEAGNVAPVPNLDGLASTAAGVGVQLVSVWHDLSQLHARYGERANTILNNHRAKLILSAIADQRTLEYVSGVLGQQDAERLSHTYGERQRSTTSALAERPLAPPHLTRQQARMTGLLIYGHLPPVQVRLRGFDEDPRLRELAAGGSGTAISKVRTLT